MRLNITNDVFSSMMLCIYTLTSFQSVSGPVSSNVSDPLALEKQCCACNAPTW